METKQLYYVSGTGRATLEACYRLLDLKPEDLPDNPDDFDAGERRDGLVTYDGPHSIWEAMLRITVAQVERLANSLEVDEVSPIR